MLNKIDKVEPNTKPVMTTHDNKTEVEQINQVRGSNSPDAKGLFFFVEWTLSESRSNTSFIT